MADVVLVSTADWDHPLWTNKQHVACSLLDEGHRILYVDSLGLRMFQPTGRDLRRVISRLRRGLSLPRQVRKGLWVWSPLFLPGGNQGIALMLNRLSLAMGLRLALWFIEFRRPWLWTYNPLTARFLSLKGFSLCIYHAVDALQEQPCMPREVIEAEEQRLCRLVDQVFVTSPQLKRQLEPHSARIRYDPNVANQDHFAQAMNVGSAGLPSDLAVITLPRIGFIGAVSSYKLDFELVVAVARSKPLWQFVFIGPTGEGEPFTDISLLEKEPNIHLLGKRAYEDLPRYCAGFACGWLPLRLTPYTEAMFPMKFFEYISAGLPVVATEIDALREFSSVAWLCDDTPEAFSKALTGCLAGHGPDQSVRLAMASQYTYQARTKRMLSALEALP